MAQVWNCGNKRNRGKEHLWQRQTKRNTFRNSFCSAPEANGVQLVGDFTPWQSKAITLVKQAISAVP
jgi:hypothetical protein